MTLPRRAVFAGSFDPFTLGHEDIARRGLLLFDELVIAVGVNTGKAGWLPAAERVRALRRLYAGEPRVSVEGYSCLTADFARSRGAAFLLRGARDAADYEYERRAAEANRSLAGLETVVLCADPRLGALSSSLTRELARFGRDIAEFLPEGLRYEHIPQTDTPL